MGAELARVTRGSAYVWCATEQVSDLRRAFVAAGMTTRLGVWHKTNPAPLNGQRMWLSAVEVCVFARKPGATFNRFCAAPVWKGPAERVRGFPCPKPVWLFRELIEASTNPGDLVLDPYLGSGTSGVACALTGRAFVGVEREPAYHALARARVDAALGRAALAA